MTQDTITLSLKSYLFIQKSQFNLYRVLINLKYYNNFIFFILLNKNTIRSANLIFEIGNAILIRAINHNILLKLIMFYIIFINTWFLLYLVNINKLKILFNNIINKMI